MQYIKKDSGFTIIEIMVVVAIIGILATLVIQSLDGHMDDAKLTQAKSDLRAIDQAISLYELKEGELPSEAEGLTLLVPKFLRVLNQDPWGQEFVYTVTGDGEFVVMSYGADKAPGGEGLAADIFAYAE